MPDTTRTNPPEPDEPTPDLPEQIARRKQAAARLPPIGDTDMRDPLLGRPRPRRRRRRWTR